MRDITQQKEMIQGLEHLANYDSLTHIYNRRKFMKEAEAEAIKAKRNKNPLAALMIDIDFFKKVNDHFGHLTGDEVIKAIVQACKDRIRRTDVIGRYGGEEFAVLLTATNMKDARTVAEHIREHIEEMENISQGNKIKVTVSIGVSTAIYNEEEDINIYKLIDEADRLYTRQKTAEETGYAARRKPIWQDSPNWEKAFA